MTHNELLAYINKEIDQAAWTKEYYPFKPLQALRAVVELHRPEWVLLKVVLQGTKPDPVAICSHCSDEQWRKSYPCPTIQAVEKELA